jgi:aryl-alcohol dehydrogenase-like predicted oxidoreductase
LYSRIVRILTVRNALDGFDIGVSNLYYTAPMEEVVRAFNFVIDKGWALYWATSEWSAQQVEEAIRESIHAEIPNQWSDG